MRGRKLKILLLTFKLNGQVKILIDTIIGASVHFVYYILILK